MLLQPPEHRKFKEPNLPLDTPEQIEHSVAVDGALERRAEREMKEVALRQATFRLLAEKIVFALGVVALLIACVLWILGGCLFLVSGVGTSGAGAALLALIKLARESCASPTPWVSISTPDIKGER
jgi:hypothetical protein